MLDYSFIIIPHASEPLTIKKTSSRSSVRHAKHNVDISNSQNNPSIVDTLKDSCHLAINTRYHFQLSTEHNTSNTSHTWRKIHLKWRVMQEWVYLASCSGHCAAVVIELCNLCRT